MPKLKREDQIQKGIKFWSKKTDEILHDPFELVKWSTFKDTTANLNEYATDTEVNSLANSIFVAFKSVVPDLNHKSRYELYKDIKDAAIPE